MNKNNQQELLNLIKEKKKNQNRKITTPHSLSFAEIKEDFDLLSSIYSNEITNTHINEENESLSFILELKNEVTVSENTISIIEEFNYSDLISNKEENKINLPYGFSFKLKNQVITLVIYCFWMKSCYNDVVFELKQKLIDSTNNLSEVFLYSIVENFSELVIDKIENNNVIISWLSKVKEMNLAENSVDFFNNTENYLLSSSDDDSDNSSIEDQDEGNTEKKDDDVNEGKENKENILSTNDMINRLNIIKKNKKNNTVKNNNVNNDNKNKSSNYEQFFDLGGKVGEVITDRKSTFQAHGIIVKSTNDVDKITAMLKTQKKVAKATHNIYAYRIKEGKHITSAFDDDGEAKAGERLLELLNTMNVENTYIMVSRWFGGILLGAERFKHINDAGKNLIISNKEYFKFKG